MPDTTRVISRRRHLKVLSATTAMVALSPYRCAEAQFERSLIARILPRFVIYAALAYVVVRVLTDGSRKEDTKAPPPARPVPLPTTIDREAVARRAEEARLAEEAAKLELARQLASKLRLDPIWGRYIVDTHGLNVGRGIVAGTIAVWPQHDSSRQRVFDLTLTNHTNESQSGGMHIVIRDVATNEQEFNYLFKGYRIAPLGTLTYATPFDASFKRAGLKEISLRNQGVLSTVPTEVVVLPIIVKGS